VRIFILPVLMLFAAQTIAGGQTEPRNNESKSAERPVTRFKAVLHPTKGGALYGDFTLQGPLQETLVPLPRNIGEVVRDSAGNLFGMGNHELQLLDLPNKKGTNLAPEGVGRLSWTMGLSYDTKRDRVLVATLGGKGEIYTCVHKTGTWSILASLDNVDVTGIAYVESLDRIFALAAPGTAEKRNMILYEYEGETGKLIRSRNIDLPLVGDFIDRALQLVSVDDSLVFIQMPKGAKDGDKPTIHLIDPKSGEVKPAPE
jgi:hypothetical protein